MKRSQAWFEGRLELDPARLVFIDERWASTNMLLPATGIPLTHRNHARAVTFATGHTRDGRHDLDFTALARPGQTLAIYMGVTTLPALREGLVAAGMDPDTPAALVEAGGTENQRVLRDTLDGIVK